MFSFDPKSRILKVQKIPEPELELNLLEYQRESYNKYVTETVYNDMQYLVQAMRDSLQVSQVEAEFRVEDLYRGSYKREVKKQSPSYYPVYAKFTIDGATFPNWVEVFRIPAMDADGILNVDGERRVLLMQMVAAERVSYAADKQTVSVTTPKRNISLIFDGTKDVMVKYGANAKIPMHKLIRAYNAKERVYDDPSKLFTSAFILSAFATDSGATDEAVEDELDKLKVHATYSGDDYSLGKTRDALNEVLSLDRAHGRILSRKVGPYEAGHRVDEEVLRYVHKNRVNELYVKAVPDIVGYKLTQELTVSFVPAGTRNNDRLIAALPQFAAYTAIPQDSEVLIHMSSKETLTDEDVMFLYDVGAAFVDCKRSGSAPIRATFEEEIIGNYTVRLGDIFGHNIPEGRYHDEWVYFYNNPNLERTDMDHLNTHDLIALYSLCGFIRKNPNENFLLDKDFGLLKKVLAANEIFSNAMREVVPEFIRKYRAAISRGIGKNMLSESNFFGLTNMWKSYLWERNYLDIADTINPIAVVAQTNHLVSTLHTSEIPEKVRLLSMGFYGRICPYETPSGQKLGVTNTKAIGAKIRDGILTTPYRRVLKNSRGEIESISAEVTYMDAQEEAQYRIGDILSLKKEGYKYLNTKVLARVPAPNNQVTVESVDAFTLDFVNAYCEQHLSPTAALIPFAGSNDAVRVTYATNMLKQSILVQGSQIPRVFTSMYRRCFNHSNTYVIRAKKDGVVDQIPMGKLLLTYDDGEVEDIEICETSVTSKSVNFLNFHAKEGDRFKKGDILVDSAIAREGIYSPGVNLFAAYLADGYNYEDAVELSEYAANQFISISTETITHRMHRQSNESIRVGREYYYRYIPENGVIAQVSRQSKSDARCSSKDVLRSGKHSGILYQIERNQDEKKAAEYNAHLLSFNRLRTGDKMAGRHSNKGTASIIRKNSEMPCFMNGRPLDILLNPCGVPSRMNIGQNFEAYLGFIAYLLDVYVESDPFNGATKGDIKLLMHYVWELANSENAKSVCSKYPMLPSTLHERAISRHAAIRDWAGCFNPDGTARLWNPATGKCLENVVTFGVPYMLKLEHEVNHKFHARAGMLEEDYSQISKQPTEGSARGGGQKMGEMELSALAAYGATDFLYETCNAMSDNVLDRVNTTLRMLNLPEYTQHGPSVPYAVEKFRYLLEVLGYKLTDDEGILPPCDAEYADSRTVPDIRSILARQKHADSDVEESKGGLSDLLKVQWY